MPKPAGRPRASSDAVGALVVVYDSAAAESAQAATLLVPVRPNRVIAPAVDPQPVTASGHQQPVAAIAATHRCSWSNVEEGKIDGV